VYLPRITYDQNILKKMVLNISQISLGLFIFKRLMTFIFSRLEIFDLLFYVKIYSVLVTRILTHGSHSVSFSQV
jgi:hypothetical protein